MDEVNITVETCEIERTTGSNTPSVQAISAPQGKYSFIHKIIDGITIIVNTVNVKFKSPAFTASVQVHFSLIFYLFLFFYFLFLDVSHSS